MTPAFISLASRFSILKLRIYAQLLRDTTLPAFKGSMLHGWLGHALKSVDENAFHVLFGEHDQQQPKPYIVIPGPDLKTEWREGEIYSFEIILFGDATNFADRLIDACKLGNRFGLGPKRCPFDTVSVCTVIRDRIQPGIRPAHLIDYLPNLQSPKPVVEAAIHIETPLRLKQHGKIIINSAPPLEQWLRHIVRRWQLLSQFWVLDDQSLLDSLYTELPVLGNYEQAEHVYFETWERWSHKGQKQLPFGGIRGQVGFYGDIALAMPWLYIGQCLHIGGKTTFGLGQYTVIS